MRAIAEAGRFFKRGSAFLATVKSNGPGLAYVRGLLYDLINIPLTLWRVAQFYCLFLISLFYSELSNL